MLYFKIFPIFSDLITFVYDPGFLSYSNFFALSRITFSIAFCLIFNSNNEKYPIEPGSIYYGCICKQ